VGAGTNKAAILILINSHLNLGDLCRSNQGVLCGIRCELDSFTHNEYQFTFPADSMAARLTAETASAGPNNGRSFVCDLPHQEGKKSKSRNWFMRVVLKYL